MDNSLSSFLGAERKRYIEQCQEGGGTAQGFRDHVVILQSNDPLRFKEWQFQALMEATTKKWQTPARKHGLDLFAIAGVKIPEYLTRPSVSFEGGEIDEDDENSFEKVDANYATVNDLSQDGLIKMRKAAQSSAAAETILKLSDEAKRRAKGNVTRLLRDLAD